MKSKKERDVICELVNRHAHLTYLNKNVAILCMCVLQHLFTWDLQVREAK